ncbi:MAG: 7-cyano-7-deazaguanine synthase QueC [Armatimonadetes bacterium]|nr:7-cyano-7-deazaguanine synthase QueC [Armatimonadota bacterium]
MKSAVVLLSGGLDSATVLAVANAEGYDCHALSFSYGQRHSIELDCAREIAARVGVSSHRVLDIPLRAFGGSALTDDIDVPKDGAEGGIPITYVPARNTIMLSLALGLAEVTESEHIFIGVNAVDYSGYPDCRPEYIVAFQNMAGLATKAGVEGRPITIHTPLIELKKTEIIQMGLDLWFDYSLTSSCYDPLEDGKPCGKCDSCRIRNQAFAALGMVDPLWMKHYGQAPDF